MQEEKKKSAYRGSSEAQRRAVAKYQAEKVEEFKVRVPKGRKDYYKQQAEARGMSLNAFCIYAMDQIIEESADPGALSV